MNNKTTVSNGKQIFWLASGRILAMLVTFFMPFFLTRFLSRQEYGVYAQFNLISLFIMAIFSFGFPNSLYYFIPRSDDREKRAVIGNTVAALMIGSFLACGLLLLPWMQNHVIGSKELLNYLPFLLVSIILFMPTEIMEPLYVTLRDHKISLWYPSTIILIKVFAVILCSMVLKGVKGVFLGLIICDIFLFISTLLYCLLKTDGLRKLSFKDYFSVSLLKKQCLYIYPFGIQTVLNTLSNRFDKMVCIKFLSTELYASYALAFFGIPGIQQIYSSIGNVYLLEITNAFKNNDLVKALHSFKELTTKTFALTVPVVWITCLYAEEIIVFLFTDRYLDAVPLFRIHIFGFIVLMLGTSLVIRASGQTKYSLYSYLYPAVFTLPCTYFAVKYYGVYGGIISTMFAQIMPKIFQAVYEIRLLETNWRYYLPWKNFGTNILIATVILLPFYVLHRFMQFNVFISGALAGLYLVIVLFLQLKFEIAVINKDAVSRILTRFHLGYFARFI